MGQAATRIVKRSNVAKAALVAPKAASGWPGGELKFSTAPEDMGERYEHCERCGRLGAGCSCWNEKRGS